MFVAVGIGVVTLAVLIGVLTAGDAGSRITVSDVARDVEIEGDELPLLDADSAVDPAVGEPAPIVGGEDFDGTPLRIGEPGRAQLITFVASWCPACQQELPELTSWLEEGNLPHDVELVAVATSHDSSRPNWPPQDWFEEERFPRPVLVDDAASSAARAYGLSGTPFWVAIDTDGEVVWRGAGMIPMAQLDVLANELSGG
jgi:thiol-disulfide isomerase/thioredoxin